MTTLEDLSVGELARIVDVMGEADGTVLRLLEMGMTPTTRVVVTRRALFGDPVEIELRGTRLCLRRADAARFHVEPIDVVGGRR